MAMKTDFTDSSVISSPFVDEVANPAHALETGVIATKATKLKAAFNAAFARTDAPTAQISKADRDKKIAGTSDERAQNQVNLEEARHGDKAGNKNRDKAEGR